MQGYPVTVRVEEAEGEPERPVERRRGDRGARLHQRNLTIALYSCVELLAQRPGHSNPEFAHGTFVARQSRNVLLQQLQCDGMVERPEAHLLTRLTELRGERPGETSATVSAVKARMLLSLNTSHRQRFRESLTARVAGLPEMLLWRSSR